MLVRTGVTGSSLCSFRKGDLRFEASSQVGHPAFWLPQHRPQLKSAVGGMPGVALQQMGKEGYGLPALLLSSGGLLIKDIFTY